LDSAARLTEGENSGPFTYFTAAILRHLTPFGAKRGPADSTNLLSISETLRESARVS